MRVAISTATVLELLDAQAEGWRGDLSGGVIVTDGDGDRWYIDYERGEIIDVTFHSEGDSA